MRRASAIWLEVSPVDETLKERKAVLLAETVSAGKPPETLVILFVTGEPAVSAETGTCTAQAGAVRAASARLARTERSSFMSVVGLVRISVWTGRDAAPTTLPTMCSRKPGRFISHFSENSFDPARWRRAGSARE